MDFKTLMEEVRNNPAAQPPTVKTSATFNTPDGKKIRLTWNQILSEEFLATLEQVTDVKIIFKH